MVMNTPSFVQLLDISISSLALCTLWPMCMLLFTAAINCNLFDFKQSLSAWLNAESPWVCLTGPLYGAPQKARAWKISELFVSYLQNFCKRASKMAQREMGRETYC